MSAEAVAARPPYMFETDEGIGGEELHFVPDELSSDCCDDRLLNADSLPILKAVRMAADRRSDEIVEERLQLLMDGEFAAVPYSHDPLSTAARANKARQIYGTTSPEFTAKYNELLLDSERLLGEAFRPHTWEYFSPIEQHYSSEHESYMSGGHSVMQVVDDGLSPLSDSTELQTRRVERREEVTVTKLGSIMMHGAGLGPTKELRQAKHASVQTISECSDTAIAQYEADCLEGKKRSYGGQVPQNKKLMLRTFHLQPETSSRTLEVLAIPGLEVDHEVVLQYLERKAVITEGSQLSRAEVLGIQTISLSGQGVIDMVRELDAIAGEAKNKNIFLGEVVDSDHPKDYRVIADEAARRKEQQKILAVELTDYLLDLEDTGIDHWNANRQVENRVKSVVFGAVIGKPEEAAHAFDDETAQLVEQAASARAEGRYDEAMQIEQAAYTAAPPVEFCSGGSCGIQEVDKTSVVGKKLAAELGLADNETIAIDKVRRCQAPDCNGVIGYIYSDKRVKKFCLSCSRKENKVSIVKAA